MGSNLIVFGFAAINRAHVESRAEQKGNPLLLTESRQPLLGEQTFDTDDPILLAISKERMIFVGPVGENGSIDRWSGAEKNRL